MEDNVRREMKNKLEKTLEKYDGFFIAKADKKRIQENIDDPIYREEFVNDSLSRVIEHAERYKQTGEIKYKINSEFKSLEDVRNILNELGNAPFLRSEYQKIIADIAYKIDSGKLGNLSTRQIEVIESFLNKYKERTNEIEKGVVHFGLCWDDELYDYVKKSINYALGRGRRTFCPSNEEILEFRSKYVNKEGKVSLSGLNEELANLSDREDISRKYTEAIKIFESYLQKADPNKYKIELLSRAVPLEYVE
jgi:hypothetical protein